MIGKVSSCGALGDVLYPYTHSPSRFSRTSELAQKARARRFFSSRGFAAASTGWCSGESRSQLRQNRGHLDVCACNSEPGFRGRHDGLGRNDTRPGSLACRPAWFYSRLLCLSLPARIPASSRTPNRSDALRPLVGAAPHEFRLRPNLAHFRLHATATRFAICQQQSGTECGRARPPGISAVPLVAYRLGGVQRVLRRRAGRTREASSPSTSN